MTETQRQALNQIRTLIPACFGAGDRIFSEHFYDSERARNVLAIVLQHNIGRQDYENIVRDYLIAEGCQPEHIAEQIERVNNLEVYLNDETQE